MKKISKIISIVCALSIACTMVACSGNRGNNQEGDKNKTILYVSNYQNGFGVAFTEQLEKRFEIAYADYVNPETNKVGVDVVFRNSSTALGDKVVTGAATSDNAVYLTGDCFYYNLISQGAALDITDVVTGENTDGKTIESKMTDEQKAYYGFNNPKSSKTEYYAVPHYANYRGLIYNKDVFNDNSLYFAGNPDDGYKVYTEDDSYVFTNKAGVLSAGPDGKHGTGDDGLPQTYEQFFAMCDEMLVKSVVPFTWSGACAYEYMNYLLEELYVDYEGIENSLINFSLKGTADNLVKFDKDGNMLLDENGDPVTEPGEITFRNGYKIYTTAGRYYAYKFLESMFSNNSYYSDEVISGNKDNFQAQSEFLNSTKTDSPIAMLVDGTWWENEAKDYGTYKRLKCDINDFNFGLMYMPKPTMDEVGTEDAPARHVVAEDGTNIMFVNAHAEKSVIDIAKKFVAFANTDESLQEFTALTNAFKALKYDIAGEKYDNLSNFGKDVYSVINSEYTDVLHQGGQNDIFITNPANFIIFKSMSTETLAYNNFKGVAIDNDGLDAKAYFEKYVSINSSGAWNSKYDKILENITEAVVVPLTLNKAETEDFAINVKALVEEKLGSSVTITAIKNDDGEAIGSVTNGVWSVSNSDIQSLANGIYNFTVVNAEANEVTLKVTIERRVEISTATELYTYFTTRLKNIEDFIDDKIILKNDIDMSQGDNGIDYTQLDENGYPVYPLGCQTPALGSGILGFNGTFDGQGHTIKGLIIGDKGYRDAQGRQLRGLFGRILADGVVKNVSFEDLVAVDTMGIFGTFAYGTIENVYIDATLKAAGQGVTSTLALQTHDSGITNNNAHLIMKNVVIDVVSEKADTMALLRDADTAMVLENVYVITELSTILQGVTKDNLLPGITVYTHAEVEGGAQFVLDSSTWDTTGYPKLK